MSEDRPALRRPRPKIASPWRLGCLFGLLIYLVPVLVLAFSGSLSPNLVLGDRGIVAIGLSVLGIGLLDYLYFRDSRDAIKTALIALGGPFSALVLFRGAVVEPAPNGYRPASLPPVAWADEAEKLDLMSGVDFELHLERMFRVQGYTVKTTRVTGDFGADLVLERDGHTTIVQAKRSAQPVGVKAIQEAIGARSYYQTDYAYVVTNRSFTPGASELASISRVELWDRRKLLERLAIARALAAVTVEAASQRLDSSGLPPDSSRR